MTDTAEPIPLESEPFVRTCGTDVYGELAEDWREESVVVGPLAFAYLQQLEDPSFASHFETNRGLKVLVVVEPNATATVIVPAHAQKHPSLLYDPSKWTDDNVYEVFGGDAAVNPSRPVRKAPTPNSMEASSWPDPAVLIWMSTSRMLSSPTG